VERRKVLIGKDFPVIVFQVGFTISILCTFVLPASLPQYFSSTSFPHFLPKIRVRKLEEAECFPWRQFARCAKSHAVENES